jgi:hypothetical protein
MDAQKNRARRWAPGRRSFSDEQRAPDVSKVDVGVAIRLRRDARKIGVAYASNVAMSIAR